MQSMQGTVVDVEEEEEDPVEEEEEEEDGTAPLMAPKGRSLASMRTTARTMATEEAMAQAMVSIPWTGSSASWPLGVLGCQIVASFDQIFPAAWAV